jgi:hypothetical protein
MGYFDTHVWIQFSDHEVEYGQPCPCGELNPIRIHPNFLRCPSCGSRIAIKRPKGSKSGVSNGAGKPAGEEAERTSNAGLGHQGPAAPERLLENETRGLSAAPAPAKRSRKAETSGARAKRIRTKAKGFAKGVERKAKPKGSPTKTKGSAAAAEGEKRAEKSAARPKRSAGETVRSKGDRKRRVNPKRLIKRRARSGSEKERAAGDDDRKAPRKEVKGSRRPKLEAKGSRRRKLKRAERDRATRPRKKGRR